MTIKDITSIIHDDASKWIKQFTEWSLITASVGFVIKGLMNNLISAISIKASAICMVLVSLAFLCAAIGFCVQQIKLRNPPIAQGIATFIALGLLIFSIYSLHSVNKVGAAATSVNDAVDQAADKTATVTIPFQEVLLLYGDESPSTPIYGQIDLENLIVEESVLVNDSNENVSAKMVRNNNEFIISDIDAGSYTFKLKFQDYEEQVISFSVAEKEERTLNVFDLKSLNIRNNCSILVTRSNGNRITDATVGLSVRNALNTTNAQALNNLITDSYGSIPLRFSYKQGIVLDLSWAYGGKTGKEVIVTKNEDGDISCVLPLNDEADIYFIENGQMDLEFVNGTGEGFDRGLRYWDSRNNFGLNNLNYPNGRLIKLVYWQTNTGKGWSHAVARVICNIPEHTGNWDYNGILVATQELENSPSHAKVNIRFNGAIIYSTYFDKTTTDEFRFEIHAKPGDEDRFFIEISADVANNYPFSMGLVLPHENQAVVEESAVDIETTAVA